MISFLLFLLSLLPLLLGNDYTKQHGDVVFLAFAIVGAAGCMRGRNLFSFLSPVAIVFFYVSLSLSLGSWGFSNEYVINARNLAVYDDWQSTHIAATVLMLSLSVLMSVDNHYRAKYESITATENLRVGSTTAISSMILLPFFFIPLDLSAFGGLGDFSGIAKSVFALLLVVSLSGRTAGIRWAAYLIIIVVFATFSVHEKREAIFLIFPILFFEILQHPRKLTVRSVSLLVPLAGFLLLLIIAMSVARGYGGFGEMDTLFSAVPFVLKYVSSENFIGGLLNNIEANYFFFHAINAIEMAIRDSDLIVYGSTLIKPLFILIPRSIAPWKPEGMITLYTTAFDPSFRTLGGSWPASFISELFWNFSYLCIPLSVFLALGLVKLQFLLLRAHAFGHTYLLVLLLFAYMNVLTLMRGSGLDQYLVSLIFAGLFVFAVQFAARILPIRRQPIDQLDLQRQ